MQGPAQKLVGVTLHKSIAVDGEPALTDSVKLLSKAIGFTVNNITCLWKLLHSFLMFSSLG